MRNPMLRTLRSGWTDTPTIAVSTKVAMPPGAPPWRVESRESAGGVIHIYLSVPRNTRWRCPACGSPAPIHDHRERTWRAPNDGGLRTLVHAHVPRLFCSVHEVKQLAVPWAKGNSRFTIAFETHAQVMMLRGRPTPVANSLGILVNQARRMKQSWRGSPDILQVIATEREWLALEVVRKLVEFLVDDEMGQFLLSPMATGSGSLPGSPPVDVVQAVEAIRSTLAPVLGSSVESMGLLDLARKSTAWLRATGRMCSGCTNLSEGTTSRAGTPWWCSRPRCQKKRLAARAKRYRERKKERATNGA